MKKKAAERDLAKKQTQEKLDLQKKPLKLKSFLGFEFLSKSTTDGVNLSVKLQKPFRSFSEAQLSYSPMGRLYCITITNTFPQFVAADVETEVRTIATILEKKYNFKFFDGVVCNDGISMTGGVAMPGARSATPTRVFNTGRTTYRAYRRWSDVSIEVEGIFYRPKGDVKKSPCVSVTVKMPEILELDRKAKKDSAQTDEDGLDVL